MAYKRMKLAFAAMAVMAATWATAVSGETPKLTEFVVTTSPKTNVTVRGTGTAGRACKLEWTEKLGTGESWKHAGDTTVKSNGTFAVIDEEFLKPGFYRVKEEVPEAPVQYLVVDMSGGTNALKWPTSVLKEAPQGGWGEGCKTTNLVLRRFPAGTYVMGSPANELGRSTNEVQHTVVLTEAFFIGMFEVTQAQWKLATGSNPSPSGYMGDTRPVVYASYDMIRGSVKGAGWPANSQVDEKSFIYILRAKTGLSFDLPTEAQWECACRAGTATALNSGKDLTGTTTCANLAAVGRYAGNRYDGQGGCNGNFTTVGNYLPNDRGLFDMHGNVEEWCLDWFGPLPSATETDPKGRPSGTLRTVRGGSCELDAKYCRSASRAGIGPANRSTSIGFRLACPAWPW